MLGGCGIAPSASDATGGGSGPSSTASPEASPSGSPGTSDSPTGSSGPAAQPPAPVPDDVGPKLARFYRQKLDWHGCRGSGNLQCATLRVPEDYQDPGGRTIELAVLRLPAKDQQRRAGSLVVNPGGPGGSGIDYARYAALVVSRQVRERYDVVGFDPRGVGKSTPVDCLTDPQLDRFLAADGSPDNPREVQRLLDLSKQFAQGCERRSGDLLAHVSTEAAARDMDVLRGALGDGTLTYLGKSYGTFLGATYAELFPRRAGRLVLDGALDPSLSATEVGIQQAKGFEVALKAFLRDCVTRDDCPLGHSLDEAYQRLDTFLADVDRNPLPTNGGRQLTQSLALTGVIMPLYVKEYWPRLRSALQAGLDGDGSPLLRMADEYAERTADGYKSNSNEVILAVNCLDRPDISSVREAKKLQPRFEKASPRFGAYILWGSLPCAVWPVDAEGRPHEIHAPGAPPILVVGTTRDPATPYAWAKRLADQLDSGVLLSRDGDGHTAYMEGNSCIDDAVDRFILAGKPPPDGKLCS